MATMLQSDKLSRKTKVFFGIRDIGNAVVNSAIQFFSMSCLTVEEKC
jgi:hypothetical protein